MLMEAVADSDLVTNLRNRIFRNQRRRLRLVEQLEPALVARPTTTNTLRPSVNTAQAPTQAALKAPALPRQQRSLVVSSATFGLAVGGLFFHPLMIAAIPGVIYNAYPIYQRAYSLFKTQRKVGAPTVTLITVASSIAFGYVFISSLATFMFTLSDELLKKVMRDTRGELIDIFKLTPNEVWLLIDGVEVSVPIAQVKRGDLLVVHAGGIIPVDGVIRAGIASIDQHILTGEGTPVEKEEGEEVFASTVVHSGRIVVEVQHAGNETTLAKIGDMLNKSIEFKSTVTLRAMELADRTALPAILLGVATLPILGPESAVAVTNSHFKNKMGLITPLSIMNFFKIALRHGIIIKDGRSFELLNQVDTIVFDKTGTLTEEQPTVGKIHLCHQNAAMPYGEYDEKEVLRFAATAEYRQSHPIARAILQRAAADGLDLPVVEEIDYRVGYGLSVTVAGQLIQVGSIRFMQLSEIDIPITISAVQESCFEQGHSLLMVAVNQHLIGAIELIPTIRPETQAVLETLMARSNITASYIISGDNETPTRMLAQKLGIDHYFAETLPEDKAKLIRQLRDQGRFICYVGDGINDSIALKQAHVSISLSGASQIAIDTAQIVLTQHGLTHLNLLFNLAKRFEQNTNLTFAAVTIPALLSVGSVFFFGAGLGATVAFNMVGLGGGVATAMLPALRERIHPTQG